jgi:ferredoxin
MSERNIEHVISFSPESHPPINLVAGANLSEYLTAQNSPVLFGCRTGICGTCLIEIEHEENGALPPPSDDELELLEIIASDMPRARLACQIDLRADIRVRYLGKCGL